MIPLLYKGLLIACVNRGVDVQYDVNEILRVLLEVFGVIAIIATGIKGLLYLVDPVSSTRKKVEEHDKFLADDKAAIENLTELTKDILKIQLSMLNHAIDGNGVDNMKMLREELQDKL